MIIGHYDSELWARGGVSSYIQQISQAQQQEGHQVYYFSLHSHPQPSDISEPPIFVANGTELFARAQELGVDILHLHKSSGSLPPTDLPVLRTVHGHQPYCPSGSQFLATSQQPCDRTYHPLGCLWGHLFDRCGSRNPKVIQFNFQHTQDEWHILTRIPTAPVSHFVAQQMQAMGYPADNLHPLPLFAPIVTDPVPPPRTDIPHFLFLGRLSPEKGIPFLLNAMQQVSAAIHLEIAGDSENATEIQTQVEKLGLSHCITFHGWLSRQQIVPLIQQSRALIFPSLWHEPAGFITLEAAAHGRAVIATRVGGLVEYAQALQNTILTHPWDTAGLAQAIDKLAQNWELADQLGKRGKHHIEPNFSFHTHYQKLMKLYDHVRTMKGQPRSIPRLPISPGTGQ